MLRVREAIEFPFRGPRWPYRLGLGGILCAFPIFAFTILGQAVDLWKSLVVSVPFGLLYFLIGGYVFNVFRAAFHQEAEATELSAWDDWTGLLFRGFLLFVIEVGYGLLPLLIMALGIGVLYRGGWWLFTGMLLLMIGMLTFLLVGFFFPMGVSQYIRWKRLEAAFLFPSLWRAIRSVLVEYVSVFLFCVLALLALGFVALIPVLGPMLSSFLSFYPIVVAVKLFGEVCSRSGTKA